MNKNTNVESVMICLLLLTCSLTFSLSAQEQHEQWEIKLGAVSLSAKQPWTGAKQQVTVAPFISAKRGNWSFGVDNLASYRHQFPNNLSIRFGLELRSQAFNSKALTFNKPSNDKVFKDYETPELEIAQKNQVRWGWVSLNHSIDISSNSKSESGSLALSFPLYQNHQGVSVSSEIAANWYDKSFVNYYYGVDDKQVNNEVGRTFYQTDDAVNYQFSLETIYPLNRKWAIVNLIKYTNLDKRIFNSPLIDKKYQSDVILAITYAF